MRILIMNDDCHETMYCFENGKKLDLQELFEVLAPTHFENYEMSVAFWGDIQEEFAQLHPDFDSDDIEQIISNLFDHIMYEKNVDWDIYTKSFNEIWELAYLC